MRTSYMIMNRVANLYHGIPVKTGTIDLPYYRCSTLVPVQASWLKNHAGARKNAVEVSVFLLKAPVNALHVYFHIKF